MFAFDKRSSFMKVITICPPPGGEGKPSPTESAAVMAATSFVTGERAFLFHSLYDKRRKEPHDGPCGRGRTVCGGQSSDG
jgi:hypothetical protein